MCPPALPQFLSHFFEGDVREVSRLGFGNTSLVIALRKPLPRKLFDDPRRLTAMQIHGIIEFAKLS
jgi:hypothetical protein